MAVTLKKRIRLSLINILCLWLFISSIFFVKPIPCEQSSAPRLKISSLSPHKAKIIRSFYGQRKEAREGLLITFPFLLDITASQWSKVCPVVVQASKVQGTHSNFTIHLDETSLPSELFSIARSDGGDLRFCLNIDGTNELARDIIRYNSSGLALISVLLPSLTTVDKTIYCFYGNASATDYAHTDTYGAHNAYDSDHLLYVPIYEAGNGTSNEYQDRTSNHYHGTGGGSNSAKCPDQDTLLMNAGNRFVNTSNDYIYFGLINLYPTQNQPRTMEIWARPETESAHQMACYNGSSSGTSYRSFIIFRPSSGYNKTIECALATGYLYASNTNAYSQNNTYHVAYTWDGSTSGSNVPIYINGALDVTRSHTTNISGSGEYLNVGNMGSPTYYNNLLGKAAHFKMHKTNRSADWIKTEYNNISSASTFAVAGTPQSTAAEKSYIGYGA